jgi:SAM-dependent methyltransferase
MLEHARRNAGKAGLQNIEFLECAAEDLEENLIPFDASISRLGLMLFPSPGNALGAILRVLKPGARFAALVFTTPSSNAFMARPMAILVHAAGKSAPAPGQPGIFALGGDGILENLMKGSGFLDVKSTKIWASLRLESASDALEMMQQGFGAYRAVVAELSDQEKSKAWGQVYDCLRDFEGARGFETEFEFMVGCGARPN